MIRHELTRADVVRIVKEECVDSIVYADILTRDDDRALVRRTIRTLWRSIEARLPSNFREGT